MKVCLHAHFPGDTHVPPFWQSGVQIAETKHSVVNYFLIHFYDSEKYGLITNIEVKSNKHLKKRTKRHPNLEFKVKV